MPENSIFFSILSITRSAASFYFIMTFRHQKTKFHTAIVCFKKVNKIRLKNRLAALFFVHLPTSIFQINERNFS